MSNVGKTLAASWAMRTTNPSFTTKEIVVLYAFISFMDASGFSSPGTARLMFVTRLGKASVRRAVEILESSGIITLYRAHADERCAGYIVNVEKIADQESVCPPSNAPTPRTLVPVRTLPGASKDPPWCPTDHTPGSSSDPFEDPVEDKKISEDHASLPLAPLPLAPTQPSQATPPSTTRSPATLPTEADPCGLAPTIHVTASPAKLRKPRAAKPVITALTVEALTPDERAVHDAIVQDVTLVQICVEVPQLARDLIAIATDQAGRITINVVAEVRKAAGWNRDNAGTVKAWSTKGGNRGLRSWIERAMARTPTWHQSTLPSPLQAPAIATPLPPTIVDLGKNPELMPLPRKSARY